MGALVMTLVTAIASRITASVYRLYGPRRRGLGPVPASRADLTDLPLFGYACSRFPDRFARPAAAFGISRAALTIGLASSELPQWGELGRPGQEARYRTMRGLPSQLMLTCTCR
jgi:hypothetical protein